MPTIAITGASGHLGSVILTELLKDDAYQIRAQFNSQRPPIDHPNITWIRGGMKPDDLTELIKNSKFVIHCAAIISITGDKNGLVYQTNVQGTEHVIDVCLTQKVDRLVHVSSTHALQEIPLNSVFDENRPYKTEQDFAYDFSKAKAEQLVLNAVNNEGLNAVIVRPSSMLGPVDYKPSLLGEALTDIAHGKIPAMVQGGYDFVDVRDVAKSIIQALTKGQKGESFNLTGKYYPIKELANKTALIANVKPPRFVVPGALIQLSLPFVSLQSKFTKKPPKFTRESIHVLKYGHPNMSHAKAQTVLGHTIRPIESTIQDFLEWKKII